MVLQDVVAVESLVAFVALIGFDSIVAPEMVHHVTLGAEALAACLGAVERPVVIVHSHMDGQVVPVVEGLLAVRHRADEICPRLMVCKVSLKVLL